MDLFYAIREPVGKAVARILARGHRVIPSDQKGVFITLFFIIFTTVTGVGIVVPLLPVYAHDLGAAGIYVAMIFGAFSISRTLFLPVFGRLSDHKGRKPFIMGGLFSYVLVSLAFVFADDVNTLILIRCVQGVGSAMVMPVVQAYVGEITPEGTEGYSMGLFNLSMFLSLSLGPLMGGTIQDLLSMKGAFLCMAGLSLAGFLLACLFLPPLSMERLHTKKREPVPYALVVRDREMAGLILFRYAYTAGIGIIWCFLPLYADQAFGFSGTKIGFLVMLGVFVSGVLQLPMGVVADRFNKTSMILAGGLLSATGLVLPFFAHSFFDLLVGVSIFGLGGGISMPAVTALAVIKGEEKQAMGSVMAVMTVAHSLGMFTGSVMAGLTMDFFKLSYAFPFGFGVLVFGSLAFPLLHRRAAVPKRI